MRVFDTGLYQVPIAVGEKHANHPSTATGQPVRKTGLARTPIRCATGSVSVRYGSDGVNLKVNGTAVEHYT